MSAKQAYKTGQKCPQTGFWKARGTKSEIALSRKDRFPPSGKKSASWKLVREARY